MLRMLNFAQMLVDFVTKGLLLVYHSILVFFLISPFVRKLVLHVTCRSRTIHKVNFLKLTGIIRESCSQIASFFFKGSIVMKATRAVLDSITYSHF